jgi:hypothetical protein
MSPESADKKQREVEAYFKFRQEAPPPPPPSCPSRYLKGKRDPNYEHRIRKSASQGQIMNRQKSYSDGDDEDDNVDQIFESLFKASGTPSLFERELNCLKPVCRVVGLTH